MVRASFYEEDSLTHRDLLGSLMALGVTRETLGIFWCPPLGRRTGHGTGGGAAAVGLDGCRTVRLHTASAAPGGPDAAPGENQGDPGHGVLPAAGQRAGIGAFPSAGERPPRR